LKRISPVPAAADDNPIGWKHSVSFQKMNHRDDNAERAVERVNPGKENAGRRDTAGILALPSADLNRQPPNYRQT
jgi:hypothetical protein